MPPGYLTEYYGITMVHIPQKKNGNTILLVTIYKTILKDISSSFTRSVKVTAHSHQNYIFVPCCDAVTSEAGSDRGTEAIDREAPVSHPHAGNHPSNAGQ